MDRRERSPDPYNVMRMALLSHQAAVWTALPGTITAFDAVHMTCEVRPGIQARVSSADGTEAWVEMPLLLDVPVLFPGAGGYTLTFPVVAGDEVLVVFASRCIDAWWQSGGVQQQLELRMHDLSDGFAILGARNQTRTLSPVVNSGGMQLRNDAGTSVVELTASHIGVTTAGTVDVAAASSATIAAPTISLTGAVTVTGPLTVTGATTAAALVATSVALTGGLNFATHHHTGVQTGSGSTGGPV